MTLRHDAVIDPTAFVDEWARLGAPPEHRVYWHDPSLPIFPPQIGAGARIHAFVTIDAGLHAPTRIGKRVACMAHTHVGHDAILGDDCELAPGTVIGGHCEIGNGVRFGVNACVRPFIKIGALARIGAGAVVIRDVPPGQVWAGNPARQIRTKGAYVPPNALEQAGWDELAEAAAREPEEMYR